MAVASGRDTTVYVNRGTPDAPEWVRVAGPARREERMDFLRHPDYLARLAAVLADPADDGPRLVVADWLDERPENAARLYAEFIRVQVELARPLPRSVMHTPVEDHKACPKCQADARLVALDRRERELWGRCWEMVVTGLPKADESPSIHLGCEVHCGIGLPIHYVARRGFVQGVAMPAACLDRLDPVRAVQPVTNVTLTTTPTLMVCATGRRVGVATVEVTGAVSVRVRECPGKEAPAGEGPVGPDRVAWGLGRLWPGIAWTLPPGDSRR